MRSISLPKCLHRKTFNLIQVALERAGLPPIDNFNNESGSGETFLCDQCGYLRPWSRGCGGDMAEVCDHCFYEHSKNGETIDVEIP